MTFSKAFIWQHKSHFYVSKAEIDISILGGRSSRSQSSGWVIDNWLLYCHSQREEIKLSDVWLKTRYGEVWSKKNKSHSPYMLVGQYIRKIHITYCFTWLALGHHAPLWLCVVIALQKHDFKILSFCFVFFWTSYYVFQVG